MPFSSFSITSRSFLSSSFSKADFLYKRSEASSLILPRVRSASKSPPLIISSWASKVCLSIRILSLAALIAFLCAAVALSGTFLINLALAAASSFSTVALIEARCFSVTRLFLRSTVRLDSSSCSACAALAFSSFSIELSPISFLNRSALVILAAASRKEFCSLLMLSVKRLYSGDLASSSFARASNRPAKLSSSFTSPKPKSSKRLPSFSSASSYTLRAASRSFSLFSWSLDFLNKPPSFLAVLSAFTKSVSYIVPVAT